MIKRHPMCHARASVMSDNSKRAKAQVLHYLDLILRHHALGISLVFRVTRRFSAVAKPAQIGTNDSELLSQLWRNQMPADMRLRIAVQQENRIAATTSNEVDC